MKRSLLVLALCLATANAGGQSPPGGGSGQKVGGRGGSDPWVSSPGQGKGGEGAGRNGGAKQGGAKQGGGKGQQQDPWPATTGGRQPAGGQFGVQPEDPWPSTNTGRQGGAQTPGDPWVNGNLDRFSGEQPEDPWPASNTGRQDGQTTRDPWVNGNSGNFGGQTTKDPRFGGNSGTFGGQATRDPWVNGNSGNFGGQTTKDPRFGGNSGTFGGQTTKDPWNNGKGGLFGGPATTPDPWIQGDVQANQGTRFPSSAGGQSSKPSSSGNDAIDSFQAIPQARIAFSENSPSSQSFNSQLSPNTQVSVVGHVSPQNNGKSALTITIDLASTLSNSSNAEQKLVVRAAEPSPTAPTTPKPQNKAIKSDNASQTSSFQQITSLDTNRTEQISSNYITILQQHFAKQQQIQNQFRLLNTTSNSQTRHSEEVSSDSHTSLVERNDKHNLTNATSSTAEQSEDTSVLGERPVKTAHLIAITFPAEENRISVRQEQALPNSGSTRTLYEAAQQRQRGSEIATDNTDTQTHSSQSTTRTDHTLETQNSQLLRTQILGSNPQLPLQPLRLQTPYNQGLDQQDTNRRNISNAQFYSSENPKTRSQPDLQGNPNSLNAYSQSNKHTTFQGLASSFNTDKELATGFGNFASVNAVSEISLPPGEESQPFHTFVDRNSPDVQLGFSLTGSAHGSDVIQGYQSQNSDDRLSQGRLCLSNEGLSCETGLDNEQQPYSPFASRHASVSRTQPLQVYDNSDLTARELSFQTIRKSYEKANEVSKTDRKSNQNLYQGSNLSPHTPPFSQTISDGYRETYISNQNPLVYPPHNRFPRVQNGYDLPQNPSFGGNAFQGPQGYDSPRGYVDYQLYDPQVYYPLQGPLAYNTPFQHPVANYASQNPPGYRPPDGSVGYQYQTGVGRKQGNSDYQNSPTGSQTQNGYPQEFPSSGYPSNPGLTGNSGSYPGFPSNTGVSGNSGSYPGFPTSSGTNPGFPSNTGVSGNSGSYPGYPSGNTGSSGNKPGYPSSNPGYPSSNPGFPGSPSSNTGYPSSNTGYPSSNTGYPSSNTGYPSPNTGYPSSNTGYPSSNTGYPSSNTGYPSPNPGFPSGNNGGGRQGGSSQQVDPRCQLSSGTSSCPLLDYAQMYCTKGVQDQQLGQYMTSLFQCVSNKVRVAGSCPSQESAMGRSLFEDAPAENCLFQQGQLCEVAQTVQRFNGAVFGAISLQDTKGFQNKIISVFSRVLPYCENK